MAAPPVAETTGVAVRCRTLRAVNAPGVLAGERQRRTRRPAGRRLADPVWPAAGEGPRRRGYAQFHSPWHRQLTRRLSCVFARILRSLMHTLLSWQLKSRKPAQVSTN